MQEQNFKNHIRFYPPHHFIFYPLILILTGFSIFHLIKEEKVEFLFIAVILILIGWLSFMLRQHYALNNQNRIIRLEMRLRYYQLTHERFEPIEQKLTFRQLSALRFASDSELIELIDRALKNDLNPNAIKQSIREWVPDYMRV